MGLFEQWKDLANNQREQKEYDEFWGTYLEKEKKNYEDILGSRNNIIEGTVNGLSAKYGMDAVTFLGFLDGINSSLTDKLELESLTEDASIKIEIDFEKLYFNMLDAKADWLYNLPQWNDILTDEKRKEIAKEYRKSKIAVSTKVGRNDPCTCGSGKKYKKCCGKGE